MAQDWPKCKHWFQWQSVASLSLLCHCANPLPLEKIKFPRQVLFMNADRIHIWIYFDGSKQAVGPSVIIQNFLPDGTVVSRLLCNKSRLCTAQTGSTAPRAELTACLISSRVYSLIKDQLREFLEQFQGKVTFLYLRGQSYCSPPDKEAGLLIQDLCRLQNS